MSAYSCFSKYYDILTSDIDYKGRADYLYGLFKSFGDVPTLLLDLACGTGGFSFCFANMGIDVIGVDPSEDMLAVAREKAENIKKDILFLCQSGQELDLYGTVDGAICCLDSINHITDILELEKLFSKVALFLEKDKLFIFDVNTIYKHESILANNVFVRENEDMFFVWQNEYDADTKTTNVYLDFFEEQDGKYIRSSEDFSERAYSDDELRSLLGKTGFKIEAVYGDMTNTAPDDDSQRNIYVVRKV